MRKHQKWLFLLLLLAWPSVNVAALGNKSCFMCHNSTKIKAKTEQGKNLQLYVSKKDYLQSGHEKLKCVTCHKPEKKGAFFKFPHLLKNRESENCRMCHNEVSKSYSTSIHERHQPDRYQCTTCHNPHVTGGFKISSSDIEHADEGSRSCLYCHDHALNKTSGMNLLKGIDESHQGLAFADQHIKANSCVDCHTPPDDISNHHVTATTDVVSCVECHNPEDLQAAGGTQNKESEGITLTNYFKDINRSYLPGALRIVFVDQLIGIALLVVLICIVVHAVIRFVMAQWQNKEEPYVEEEDSFYRLSLRLWHWLNAALFLLLIATGFSIHFTERDGSWIDFALAVDIHNVCGGALVITYGYYLISSVINGNIRKYIPMLDGFIFRISQQMKYYVWGIFIGAEKPFHPIKNDTFNELQRISYIGVIFVLFPVLIASGLGLAFPDVIPETLFGLEGSRIIAMIHYLTAASLVLFIIIHIYLTTTGDKPSFLIRAMITGKHRTVKYQVE